VFPNPAPLWNEALNYVAPQRKGEHLDALNDLFPFEWLDIEGNKRIPSDTLVSSMVKLLHSMIATKFVMH